MEGLRLKVKHKEFRREGRNVGGRGLLTTGKELFGLFLIKIEAM